MKKLLRTELLRPVLGLVTLQLLVMLLPGTSFAKSAPSPAVLNGRAKAIFEPITAAYLKLYAEAQTDSKESPAKTAYNTLENFNQNFAGLKSPESIGASKTAYTKAVQLYKDTGTNTPTALANWEAGNEAIWAGVANWGLDEASVLTDEIAGASSKSDEATLTNQVQLTQQSITLTQQSLTALSQAIVLTVSSSQSVGSSQFIISVTDTPGTKLDLFVNGKKKSSTNIDVNDGGTFGRVKLTGTGKLSFTRVVQQGKKTVQKPAGSTTYFTVSGDIVSFSKHAATPKVTPKPTPMSTPTPTPIHIAQATPTPVPVAPVATPQGCTPLSDEGTCYEPGEYCRDSDQGTSGIAGDGEKITCEDNDGWRWEPS